MSEEIIGLNPTLAVPHRYRSNIGRGAGRNCRRCVDNKDMGTAALQIDVKETSDTTTVTFENIGPSLQAAGSMDEWKATFMPDGTPENLARLLDLQVDDLRDQDEVVLAEIGNWDVEVRVVTTLPGKVSRSWWKKLDNTADAWKQAVFCTRQKNRLLWGSPSSALKLQVRWSK